MALTFGVKATKVEDSFGWVEQATGLVAVERESTDWGGVYYFFDGPNGEKIRLLSNRDLFDGETVVDGADNWLIVLALCDVPEDSPMVTSLTADAQHFVRL